MKKIYAFAFDEEDYLSDKWRNNIRLVAFLLYDSVYNYDEEDRIPLNLNKNIVFNRIHEFSEHNYYLDSDCYDDGFINYEPFLINNRCFAFTVDDNLISEKDIRSLLNSVLYIVGISSSVRICSEVYSSKNKDDERNRWKAISAICNRTGYKYNKKTYLVKRLFCRNKNKKNMNCCGRY